ncbi:hypothetical protein Q8A73_011070 [Channa argus]|nr:hypothetical protein Q8A73_011070 [Channa argus]
MAEIRTQTPLIIMKTSNPKQVATVTWARGHHPENDGVCFSTPTGDHSDCAFSPSGLEGSSLPANVGGGCFQEDQSALNTSYGGKWVKRPALTSSIEEEQEESR